MHTIYGLIHLTFAALSLNTPQQLKSYTNELSEPLPDGCLPFDEFSLKFNLGKTSTEQSHPLTKQLSQTMAVNTELGLDLLLDVDAEVITGLEHFTQQIDHLSPIFAKNLKQGGRIFFVGSGSSGRVAVDLAAKCNHAFPSLGHQVKGVIAGGEGAMIRAKEGFEDSEKDGEKALQDFHLTPQDSVILISASGSASFNVGAGHYAANQNANVYYFYNSKEIPERTQKLFSRTNNPVVALELDIGPQAINGSTRLQGATLAEACLGSLLASSFYLVQDQEQLAKAFPRELAINMENSLSSIRQHKEAISHFIHQEVDVLSNPQANFRRLHDETEQGYITFIAHEDSICEILIDSTEISPTFSTNPIPRVGDLSKKSEFSPFLVGKENNQEAWDTLLGKETNPIDRKETDQFIINIESTGPNSYTERPKGQGNFVAGVVKLRNTSSIIPKDLFKALQDVKDQHGNVGIIIICNETLPASIKKEIEDAGILLITIENISPDILGINETIALKETLNLISNGSMILMKKVHGNQMIDVRASNMKLVDRSMRLIKEIWNSYDLPSNFSNEKLYRYVCQTQALKTTYERQEHAQTPSVVKLVFTTLYLDKAPSLDHLKEVSRLLSEKNEDLDAIVSQGTLCIDGGGSKTLLQLVDANGKIIPLLKDGVEVESLQGPESNINTIGFEGVRNSLSKLFENVQTKSKMGLQHMIAKCKIIAGMAGVGLPANREKVLSLFEELGADKNNITLMTDADIALNLLPEKGIILISGTGSICLGKNEDKKFRVGGLGNVLGDKGNGYQIALSAIRASLAEEYGWGPKTSLTQRLQDSLGISDLKTLIPLINSRQMSAAEIAKISPIVFEEAQKNDAIAQEILKEAAQDLNELITTMLKISELTDSEVHLWGGVFKTTSADTFIQQIDSDFFKDRKILLVNRANENAAVEFAKMQQN